MAINIDILSNAYRIKYENLDKCYKKYKGSSTKFLLVMDIGHLIEAHLKLLDRKQIIITNKNKIQVMVSLLNIIAHYRHYYYSMLGCDNTIVLFCGDDEHYSLFKDILTDLDNILQFIKGVILVPKIEGNKQQFIYYKTVSYILETTQSHCKTLRKELVVQVLGNSIPTYQFFPIFEKVAILTPFADKKIQSYIEVWEALLGPDDRFHSKAYSAELRICLLPYMLCFKKFPVKISGLVCTLKSPTESASERVDRLFDFIKSHDINSLWRDFGDTFTTDPKLYQVMYNEIVLFSPMARSFLDNFIKSWGSKLKDKKLHNIHEYIKDLNGNLNIDWLTEVGT